MILDHQDAHQRPSPAPRLVLHFSVWSTRPSVTSARSPPACVNVDSICSRPPPSAAPKSASAAVALRQKLAPFPGHDVVQSRPLPCSKYSSVPVQYINICSVDWLLGPLVIGSSWLLFGDRNHAPAPPRQLPSQRPLVPQSANVASSPSAFASSRIGSRSGVVRYAKFSGCPSASFNRYEDRYDEERR
ncbi:uncharacterized protein [Lolium perenne]|uniref:uncharacterized protein n=1 Tax=Lolium perenne TaxID=4522 RepID=UPI0021F5EFF2|nr:uncharacterized protein LOC127301819 isoform X2 [Lolium perenne]